MRQTRLSEGTSRFSAKAQKTFRQLNASPKIWPRKKKNTVLHAKYGAFLVENSGIEPLTSCMPCKRSPERYRNTPPRKSCVNGYHLALIRYGRQAAHYDTVFRTRFGPSVRKKWKIFIPTWVYSCCVRHEENRSESCRIVFSHMDVNRMGYGYCNILYGQIRQKSLIFFVYL